jgi:glucose/mannose-6-phosphate isomerase
LSPVDPHQIGDALWRIEAAGIPRRDLPGGVAVCGVAYGAGAIAAEILGDQATAPIRDGSPAEDSFALIASYSGDDEEALDCFEEAGRRGAPRAVICTAGRLAARARGEGVPVIGVPAGFDDPSEAIVYFVLAALECAALSGIAPPVKDLPNLDTILLRLAADDRRPDDQRGS